MRARGVLAVVAALALQACAGSAAGADRLTVVAAASLTDVFAELGGQFRQQHPDVQLDLAYGGSSGLARGIVEGAPADVFASADERQMAVVADAGLAAGPAVFATNVLAIAVPRGNPAGITELADFARDDLALAVCAPEVPCGAAAERLFAAAGVTAAPDTREQDVRAALTKVELGEVDAALVYASDVRGAGAAVEGVDVPEAGRAVNRYVLTVVRGTPAGSAARDFVDLVLSDDGAAVLAEHGFGPP